MGNYDLTIEEEIKGFDEVIPENLPTDLESLIKITEKLKYASYGYGVVMIYLNDGKWSCGFRNPKNFPNTIKSKNKELVVAISDFLKYLKFDLKKMEWV